MYTSGTTAIAVAGTELTVVGSNCFSPIRHNGHSGRQDKGSQYVDLNFLLMRVCTCICSSNGSTPLTTVNVNVYYTTYADYTGSNTDPFDTTKNVPQSIL